MGGGSQCSITSQEVVGEEQTSLRDESVRLMQSVYIRRESRAIPKERLLRNISSFQYSVYNCTVLMSTKNITSTERFESAPVV